MNAGSKGTTRKALLARIHCIKKERAWSDDEYRDILQAVSGKRSAADLDFTGLARAVAQLGGKPVRTGASEDAGSEWAFVHKSAEEKRPLLRKIVATCRALGHGRTYAEGVARRQSGGVSRRLEMMSYDELYKVAQALATTQRSRQAKAPAAQGAPA
jgi:phage gp16-like protein